MNVNEALKTLKQGCHPNGPDGKNIAIGIILGFGLIADQFEQMGTLYKPLIKEYREFLKKTAEIAEKVQEGIDKEDF